MLRISQLEYLVISQLGIFFTAIMIVLWVNSGACVSEKGNSQMSSLRNELLPPWEENQFMVMDELVSKFKKEHPD